MSTKYIALVCELDKNKSGSWVITPIANYKNYEYASKNDFDVESLGKYYRVQSGKVQKLVKEDIIYSIENRTNVVIALFKYTGSSFLLYRLISIKKEEVIQMSEDSNFIVRVKAVTNPAIKVRNELNAIGVSNLFPLINLTFASVSQNGTAVSCPITFTEGQAILIADVLSVNGALVDVLRVGTDDVYYSPITKTDASLPKEKKVKSEEAVAAPVVNPNFFYFSPILREIGNALAAVASAPDFITKSAIISGPSGWGKTAFCKPLAAALGMSLTYVDMSLVLETEELFGSRSIKDGSTEFEFNAFVAAVEKGNTVVVLDELNRTHPGALGALLPLLDWRGETTVHGRKIVRGPRTIFVATRNVGVAYVGTQRSDKALIDRFAFSGIVDSIPANEEINLLVVRTGVNTVDATRIVRAANVIREQRDLGVNVSPRNTLEIAEIVKSGIHPRAAFQWNILLKEEDEDTRSQLETLLNRTFTIEYPSSVKDSSVASVF